MRFAERLSIVAILIALGPFSFGQNAEKPEPFDSEPDNSARPVLDPETGKPILENLMHYLDDLYRADSSIGTMTLKVVRPRITRTMTLKAWTKGTEHALIVVKKPARYAGQATLRIERNLWNYMPRISRTIRIPPSLMLSSWMGSDFTNDDLVHESSLLEDFESELVGRSEDPEGWRVNLKAREETVGLWDRIEYVISPDGKYPREADYYDRKGRLARVMTFTEIRDFGERSIPARLELTPTDQKGHKTVMVYDDIAFNVEVPESMFSFSRLERMHMGTSR